MKHINSIDINNKKHIHFNASFEEKLYKKVENHEMSD